MTKLAPDTGLISIAVDNATTMVREKESLGWRIFQLPSNMNSVAHFFEGIRKTLPLDPPVKSIHWDALSDSLWAGLDELPDKKILIVWPNAGSFSSTDKKSFEVAEDVFSTLCEQLADSELTVGNPKEVLVLQVR